MMEYWNDGKASFGRINACGEKREAGKREAMKLGSWEAGKLGSWEAGKLGSQEAKKHFEESNALFFRTRKLSIKFLIVNCQLLIVNC